MALRRALLLVLAVCLLPLQWFAVLLSGAEEGHAVHALSSGIGIFGAAFLLLSWAAEAGQVDIPEALALAFLALVAVLPE